MLSRNYELVQWAYRRWPLHVRCCKTVHVRYLISWWVLVLSLTVEALQGKMCQNSLLSGRGRSVSTNISGGIGRHWGIFFGFYKTRHILLSGGANCTVLRAVVSTQYRRVTDGRTDGRMDGWTDRRTDRQTDRQTDRRNCYS